MKFFNLILAVVFTASTTLGAITHDSPKRSPMLDVYGDSYLTDEGNRRIPMLGILLPDVNGTTNINPTYFKADRYSQVTGLEDKPTYSLSNGQSVPLMALTVINPATRTAVPLSAALSQLGSSTTLIVDANNGNDATCTGAFLSPCRSIKQAQSLFSDQSTFKPYTLLLMQGFYAEDPSWQPKQYVDIIGLDKENTFVGHSDDSDINLSYNEDFFNQAFENLTIFDNINITSNGFPGTIVNQLQATFFFNSVNLPGSTTLTGTGHICDDCNNGPFIFDSVKFNNCIAFAASPVTTHAFQTEIEFSDMGFVNMDMVGVDATNQTELLSSWRNNSLRNINLHGTVDVRATSTKINRIHLFDNLSAYEPDVVSLPAGQNQVILSGGALISQILKQTYAVRLNNAVNDVTTTPVTLNVFADFIVAVNQAVAGPTALTLPPLIAGDQSSEGKQYLIYDAKGDAATNNTVVTAGGTDTFLNGATTLTLKENGGWRWISYSNGVWSVVSSSENKEQALSSAPSVGGAGSETLTVAGLLTTDTILAVSQSTAGANNTAVTAYGSPGAGTLSVSWTANPGAGAVVKVLVRHQ